MWQINKSYNDPNHPTGKGWIYLNADKPMDPYHITYPVTWTGFVGQNPVTIVQKGESGKYIEDFVFENFPAGLSYLKVDIVQYIDNYLRILD
tara:strand:+ start:7941 stop:8216 length:276 start_codon:yes stop_codon:yes gene_type:complete